MPASIRVWLFFALLMPLSNVAFAGDAVKGESVFKVCSACHSVGPNAKNKLGPQLNGIVGRRWASSSNFSYSNDLQSGGNQGKVWSDDLLDQYIENPKNLAPKGKMPFAGVKDKSQREDLIAYLREFDETGKRSQ